MGCGGSVHVQWEDLLLPDERSCFDRIYQVGEKLGQGSCGQVYSASPRVSFCGHQRDCAVKVLNVMSRGTRMMDDVQLLRSARKEAMIWQNLGRHDHCVQLFEAFHEVTGQYMMVMERCFCSLSDFLMRSRDTPMREVQRMLQEMLLGLQYVHMLRIVHRDINPDNTLLGGPLARTVKLADFGSAVRLPRNGHLTGMVGTIPYISPEALSGRGHTEKTDVWSFAATAYMVLYGDFVYSPPGEATPARLAEAILAGQPEPAHVCRWSQHQPPQAASDFVRALLSRDPKARCTVEDALHLPFLAGSGPGDEAAADDPILFASEFSSTWKGDPRLGDLGWRHGTHEWSIWQALGALPGQMPMYPRAVD